MNITVPKFTINSVATNFGSSETTVVAKCNVYDYKKFFDDLMYEKDTGWKQTVPYVNWWVENPFHITLGTYKKKLATPTDEQRIRKAYENELTSSSFDRNNLTLAVANVYVFYPTPFSPSKPTTPTT